MWKLISELKEPTANNYLFYNKEWIDADFCPNGVKMGFTYYGENDQIEFAIAGIDGEGEWIHYYDQPTHYAEVPDGPITED